MTQLNERDRPNVVVSQLIRIYGRVGYLPILLVSAIILFSWIEPRFLSLDNVFNIMRQSTGLIILSMAQLMVLLVRGFDLSLASNMALVSVVSATVMLMPGDAGHVSIALGCIAGLAVGTAVGTVNGIAISAIGISPFIMTLAMTSIAFGIALTITGGIPIYNLPEEFGLYFSYGKIFGLPTPVTFSAIVFGGIYVVLNYTTAGRYFYAIGSNEQSAYLSGIRVRIYTALPYIMSGFLAALAGLLLTARTGTGEATLAGPTIVLQSVAACAIGGVSLFGGVGKAQNVLLGSLFITLIGNGMDLIRVGSYGQQIALGVVLISAVTLERMSTSILPRR